LGYARDEQGRLIFNNLDLCMWGMGYRIDEIRAAILRVQLKKLPGIISAMHRSKYRIREALGKFPRVQLRKMVDADCAKRVNQALRAEGIVTSPQGLSNVLMTDWGLHLYSNNISLVNKTSVDGHGFPWKLVEKQGLGQDYGKGLCPKADDLFERTILLAIPSCLTEHDENDIIRAFEKVLGDLL
jgi:8-amino-3,8-dideoxy-alpha-D-manno-octulosonate transaminase